ncbi:Protein NRT1/ PTR FAMILY 3.1 like [Actinidia chinensis var. chinensis]|uniref:Protein NRT1/ PTR FAMILY 3.1 like n=1 Tax=Actinidia chinensis var. chinensis TaxID=1590841 RepID=A0A2R6QVJ0_ACTCC|nr:Protein NRT1/ PTR FAMILY 3.1 like [Actinidia chinensis var. chinensis]
MDHIKKQMESEKNVTQNVEEEKKKKLGGMKTMPFIVINEVCERFAVVGIAANMITYLTKELNMTIVKAANTLTIFAGVTSLLPLIGALIADSFAGRFWTLLLGTIIYQLGLVSFTVSASLPQLHAPPCPTQENCKEASGLQLWIFFLSLLLLAVGAGGIRPCVITFAADQFDMTKSKVEARSWNFFNWYFFCLGCSGLLSLIFVVHIQDNVGWGVGLAIPTGVMAFSILVFLLGIPLYRRVKPGGSPLVRLAQVIVAATRKRTQVAPKDPALLYQNRWLDADLSTNGRLVHTDQFKWLDRAAIATEDDLKDVVNAPNLWRLVTVHRVEELKSIIRMFPIWAAGLLLVASDANQDNFQILQARSMDRHLFKHSSFQISPASLSIFGVITWLVGLVVYDRLFVPLARRFTGNPTGITCLQRMGIGFMVNILATVVSGLVEMKRKAVAEEHNLLDQPAAIIPISVFWLLPQHCLSGIASVFMSVGHMEFLYDQTPESMRSTAAALYYLAISVGNYIGTVMVTLVHKYTGKERNWLPDRNLNRGRLENYFWLMAAVQAVNLIYYVICAWFYVYKPVEEQVESNNQGDEESAT